MFMKGWYRGNRAYGFCVPTALEWFWGQQAGAETKRIIGFRLLSIFSASRNKKRDHYRSCFVFLTVYSVLGELEDGQILDQVVIATGFDSKNTLIPKKTQWVPFFQTPCIYYSSLAPQEVICPEKRPMRGAIVHHCCSFCGFLFLFSFSWHGLFF